jgi:hypothetical protein
VSGLLDRPVTTLAPALIETRRSPPTSRRPTSIASRTRPATSGSHSGMNNGGAAVYLRDADGYTIDLFQAPT